MESNLKEVSGLRRRAQEKGSSNQSSPWAATRANNKTRSPLPFNGLTENCWLFISVALCHIRSIDN